jgi:hypothetical protein
MGDVAKTERWFLSSQISSHISCKTLASDPLMAAIFVITPKSKSAPFRYLRATYFPAGNEFRFSLCLKESTRRVAFAGDHGSNDEKFSLIYTVAEFETDVVSWICSGGLPEMVAILKEMYHTHTKTVEVTKEGV